MRAINQNKHRSFKNLALMVILIGATMLSGCLDFTGKYARKREEMLKRRDDLKNEVARSISKFDMRDQLQAEINKLDAQLATLRDAQIKMQESRNE